MSPDNMATYRSNIQHEIDGAYLYRTLAGIEKRPQLKEVYTRLAETEEAHARHWEEKLAQAGLPVPRTPTWRPQALG